MTAVEWYIKKIKEARQMCDDVSMEMDIWHTLDVLIEKGEQAKETEKEQSIHKLFVGFEEWHKHEYGSKYVEIDQFNEYLETFKSE